MNGPHRRVLRRGWWVVLLVTAATCAGAAFFTSRVHPLYRASASYAVVPNSEVSTGPDVIRTLDTLERRSVIATFARLPGSPDLLSDIARRLSLEPKQLAGYRIEGSVLPSTNLIRIDVEGPDPRRAADVANAAGAATRREARHLYRVFTLRQVVGAAAPRQPFHPNPQRNLVVAAILGLFLGLAVAWAVDALRGPAQTGS